MARLLLEIQARTHLSLGKAIAQLLPHRHEQDYVLLKWIVVAEGDEKAYSVTDYEVFDDGNEDDFDIGGFSSPNPDNSSRTTEFNTIDDALAFAENCHGASKHKYVAESMIDEEYACYFRKYRGGASSS